MRTRDSLIALGFALAVQTDVYGLTPPSASDGPVRLLTCTVTPAGILEASVDNQSDDAMDCDIRCNYELGEQMFTHSFSVRIPARFQGRVGRFDTSNARAGNYRGELGNCTTGTR